MRAARDAFVEWIEDRALSVSFQRDEKMPGKLYRKRAIPASWPRAYTECRVHRQTLSSLDNIHQVGIL